MRKIARVTGFLTQSRLLEAFAKYLDRSKYQQEFIFLNPERPLLADKLEAEGFKTHWIHYRHRRSLPYAIGKLVPLFKDLQPAIVHTHLPDASLAGLIAARLAGIDGRVHTRHHGSECHHYHPRGVFYDRLINRFSKRIMATTNVVRDILVEMEGVPHEKIAVINHGFDFADFEPRPNGKEIMVRKYDLEGRSPVIGAISRFVEWKGLQYLIPAFTQLTIKYPNAKLVLANAKGDYSAEIDELLSGLSPDRFVKIDYEPNIFDLYSTFDAFVHIPIGREYEALGQTYVEALYSGVPSVFTLAGVAGDFIKDEKNALVVPYQDSDAVYRALERILRDEELRTSLAEQGREDVTSRFAGERLGDELDDLYSSLLNQSTGPKL